MHPVLRPAIAQGFPDSEVVHEKRIHSQRASHDFFPATRWRPVWGAIAVASLLAACGGGHNDNDNNGVPPVEQLSNRQESSQLVFDRVREPSVQAVREHIEAE